MEEAVVEADSSGLKCNREAQLKYLTWRVEKLVSILAFFYCLHIVYFFYRLLRCPPISRRNPEPQKPREFWKKWNLVKGIAALTSEFCPQNFFLLSFLFLLYVAFLSWLPYILCITLFLVNAHIQARQLPTVPFSARNFTDFVIFIFYLF